MDRFRRTNPSVNRIITSRMQKRLHDILKAKIKQVKPTLNLRGLKLKRVRNRKREQMVEDRNIIIDRENKQLLKRMEEIALTPQTDCHLRRHHAQTNYGHRRLHVESVNRENRLLLKRLQSAKSVYDSAKWEQERVDMLRRIRYMSEYKEDGTPKFFQFGFDEPPGKADADSESGRHRTRNSRRRGTGTSQRRCATSSSAPALTAKAKRRNRRGTGSGVRAQTASGSRRGRTRMIPKAEWGGSPHSRTALPRIQHQDRGDPRDIPMSPIASGRPAASRGRQQPSEVPPVRVIAEYRTSPRPRTAGSMGGGGFAPVTSEAAAALEDYGSDGNAGAAEAHDGPPSAVVEQASATLSRDSLNKASITTDSYGDDDFATDSRV